MQFQTLLQREDIFAQLQERAASPERIRAASAKKLLELVEYLQSRGTEPKVGAMLVNDELHIVLIHPQRFVEVTVDWHDFGQAHDGLPVMHYRLKIKEPDKELTDEKRTTNLVEAACVILCA